MSIAERLAELNLTLPAASTPVGAYVPTVQSGKLLFLSGQLPMQDGTLHATGKVGLEVDIATAQQCARIATLNALAAAEAALGSLDAVAQVVRIEVFVNSAAGFTDQAKVANGASELLQAVFDEAGKHTRLAVGMAELPLDAPVEVAYIFEKK